MTFTIGWNPRNDMNKPSVRSNFAALLLGLGVLSQNNAQAQDQMPQVEKHPDLVSLGVLLHPVGATQASPARVADGALGGPRIKRGTAAQSQRRAPLSAAFAAATVGYKAFGAKDFEAAIVQAGRAVDLEPNNLEHHLLLINALANADRLEEADQAVSAATMQLGDTPRLLVQRNNIAQRRAQAPGAAAFAALARRDTASAVANARSAIRLAPNDLAYRQLLVQALLQREQLAEAEAASTEAMAIDAADPFPQVLRAYARQRLGRSQDATADFNQALAQPHLSVSVRRQIRLIAADAAMAAGKPQQALTLLGDISSETNGLADEAVDRRRLVATAEMAQPTTPRPATTASSFAVPVLDCSRMDGPQRCAVLANVAADPVELGFAAATLAYKAFDEGRFLAAVDDAKRAVQLSPTDRDHQRLLVNALSRAGRYQEADAAATVLLVANTRDVSVLAQRGALRQKLGWFELAQKDWEAALLFSAQGPSATDVSTAGLSAVAEIGLLIELGRTSEARQRFDAALATGSTGEFAGVADIDMAYLAARVGNDHQALAAFDRADAAGKLPNTAYQDAAYSALRSRRDEQAAAYFKRTIDDVGALTLDMEPQLLFATRRAVADVTRPGGVIASMSYRGAASDLSATPVASADSLQVGVEGYWRPWGHQNGRYVELFARAFQTLHNKNGATGSETLQTAIGTRFKPFTEQNLVGSFSRVFFPNRGRSDWLAQLGYSLDIGTELRVDVASWWTTRISAEMGYFFNAQQNYALAEFQAGRSHRIGDGNAKNSGRWVVFSHLSLSAGYDGAATEKTAVGMGPGVTIRRWFREDTHNAPRSYIDWTVQYRVPVGGAERSKGLFVGVTLSY